MCSRSPCGGGCGTYPVRGECQRSLFFSIFLLFGIFRALHLLHIALLGAVLDKFSYGSVLQLVGLFHEKVVLLAVAHIKSFDGSGEVEVLAFGSIAIGEQAFLAEGVVPFEVFNGGLCHLHQYAFGLLVAAHLVPVVGELEDSAVVVVTYGKDFVGDVLFGDDLLAVFQSL